jgi:DNA primase
LHVEHNVLDREDLHAHLTGQGLAKVFALVERAITHKGDRFAEPEADRAAVETGWRHALALHEKQVGLRRAMAAAEQAWHAEGSEDALARIYELQELLNRSDGMEASIDV